MVGVTGVCQIVGDCPNDFYQPSCSRSLEEETAYAGYIDSLRKQARLSSLLEAGAAGKAWGQVLSFVTFGTIPAEAPLWKEFWDTDTGLALTGNWETSICRITPDVSDTISLVMNVANTGIGMWVKGEETQVHGRPNITAPEQVYDLFIYKLTLSVLPSGLTEHSGERDCVDRVNFYVKLYGPEGVEEQVDFGESRDPSDNIVQLRCDGPPATYTGGSAIIWQSRKQFDRVCLEFVDSNLHSQIRDELDNGKLCADIVSAGKPESIGCTVDLSFLSYDCPAAKGERPADNGELPAATQGTGTFGGGPAVAVGE